MPKRKFKPLSQMLDDMVMRAADERKPPATFRDLTEAAGLDPAKDYIHAPLRGQDLRGEDLRGFNFAHTQLEGTDFSGANVEGVCFVEANLTGCNFTGAKTDGALFRDAILDDVVGLSVA